MPIIFVDFLFIMLLAVLTMVNPEVESTERSRPGNLSVVIAWPEGNTDVDLWVIGPGQKKPVGYTNKGSQTFNLLRDDLGNARDTLPFNYENAYSRGAPAGEYIINVHCYTCSKATPVSVEVTLGGNGSAKDIFSGVVDLAPNMEATATKFRLDDQGSVVPGSQSNYFTSLRHYIGPQS